MAFKLSATGPLKDEPEARSRSSFLGSAMGAFKDKASAAATAASAAAGAAVKSAKHGIEVAKDALGPGGTSSSSFQPPPRVDEDLDLQRALEASMQSQPPEVKADAEGDSRPLAQSRAEASAFAAELQQLQSMGFDADLAEVALAQNGGDMNAALAALCGESGVSEQRLPEEFYIGDNSGPMTRHDEATAPRHAAPHQRLDGGRASTISTASSVQAQALASYHSAKASLLNVKRRAEALFGQQKTSRDYVGETFDIQVPKGGLKLPAGQSLQQRQASLEAAERRLAEAQARNAGTMDDWRRYRQFRQQQEREDRQARAERRASAQAAAKEERDREDEEEDLQRALAASMESQPSSGEAQEGSLGRTTSFEEQEDPEIFELRLQQAIAEEELQLQQALAASLEAERVVLEAMDPTCSAAAVGEEREAERARLSGGNLALLQMTTGKIQETREREKQLQESNQALQSRLEDLREALALRGQEEPQEKDTDERQEKLAESRPRLESDKKEEVKAVKGEDHMERKLSDQAEVESRESRKERKQGVEGRDLASPKDAAVAEERPDRPEQSKLSSQESSAKSEVMVAPKVESAVEQQQKKDGLAEQKKDEDDSEEVKDKDIVAADGPVEKTEKLESDKEEDLEEKEGESKKEKAASGKSEALEVKEAAVVEEKAESDGVIGETKSKET